MIKFKRCKHCRIKLTPGIALEEIYGGIPDFIGGEVVTISPTGKAKIINVLKCRKCGYSVK